MATLYNFAAYTIPEDTIQNAAGAAYTVASGYFGIVTACCHAGETFTINAVTVLSGSESTWNAIASNISPDTASYSGIGTGLITISLNGNTLLGDTFINSTARTRTSVTGTFRLVAGDVIDGSSTARYHVEIYKIPT